MDLPDGYTQLYYIEGSGKQYIKTGIYQAYPVKAEMQMATVDTIASSGDSSGKSTTTCYMLAATYSSYRSFPIRFTTSAWGWGFGTGTSTQGNYSTYATSALAAPVANTFYDIVSTISNGVQTLTVNGVTASTTALTGTIKAGSNQYILFGSNTGSPCTASYVTKARLYGCAIYTNSTVSCLAAKFVPCRRESDEAIGVYNTVAGTFLASAVSTAFVAGPDLPDEPEPVRSGTLIFFR